jgi:hypothetical protein
MDGRGIVTLLVRAIWMISVMVVSGSTVAHADQVEASVGAGLELGLELGNVSDGTAIFLAPPEMRLDWSAFIEENRRWRYRLGLVVPMAGRLALGLRPGIDLPFTVGDQRFDLNVGLRAYLVPYTLWGVEAGVSWERAIVDRLMLTAGGGVVAYFFGNDLPPGGAIVEISANCGVRMAL